ncbi:MAG: sensor histidine kinase, partial [Bacteroidota bacterium]
ERLMTALPFRKKSKNPHAKATFYSTLADIKFKNGNQEQGLVYIDTALTYAQVSGVDKLLAALYNIKYGFLLKMGRYEEGKNLPHLALKHAERNKAWNHIQHSLDLISNQAYSEENYKEAYLSLKRMDSVKSFLHSDEMAIEVRELEKSLVEERKQREISILENEKQREKNMRIAFSVISFLLVLGGVGLLYLLRQRSKYNKTLTEKNQTIEKALEANKVLMKEIHHRVKNNLQVVSSLLNLQSRYVDDSKALAAIKTGRTRVLSMSLLHQNLYKNESLKSVYIKKYFEELSNSLTNTYRLNKQIEINTDIDDVELDVDTVIPMGLIVNELVSNALKYAFKDKEKGIVQLSIKQIGNAIKLSVSDDGIGLPFDELP